MNPTTTILAMDDRIKALEADLAAANKELADHEKRWANLRQIGEQITALRTKENEERRKVEHVIMRYGIVKAAILDDGTVIDVKDGTAWEPGG